MARAGPTDRLAALGRRVTALLRKTVERFLVRRRAPADRGRIEDVLHLLERDARLKAELLDELREATRLGGGAPVHGSSQVDLAELVRSTAESLAIVARDQGVELRIRCAATSVVILNDAGALTHVVGRLFAGAIAASARGSTIESELMVSADWIRLVIRAVISDACASRLAPVLASPGLQQRTPEAAACNRLGLDTVRTLVERHGGRMSVATENGRLILTLSIPGERQGAGATRQ
jgi:signal transduction histidine kinase